MKYGMSTLGCPGWTLERVAEAASDYGFDGVELRLLDGEVITPGLVRTNLDRLKRLFGPGRPQIFSLGSSVRFSSPDRDERQAQQAELVAFCEVAHELGVPAVRIFGGMIAPEATEAATVEWVADGLIKSASTAEQAGVTIALETHDDFSTSARVGMVLARVSSPAVGALWDTVHPYRMGEPVAAAWVNLANRLVHVHLKDARRRANGEWELVLLGDGEVPCREIARALALRGYDGYLVAEWEKKWHPELAEPEVALPQHLAKMREWLRDLD